MYEEFLGNGYTEKIRHMLTADKNLLPDRIINAQVNIGTAKGLVLSFAERHNSLGLIQTEEEYKKLQDATIYYLAGIICTAMRSRTSSPPFNTKKYNKAWDKKREKYMAKGNFLMKDLLDSIGG